MSSSIDIGISEDQRRQIADGLGRLLADTWVLYGKTHGFHWNVTGPMFNSLHGMFDIHYKDFGTLLMKSRNAFVLLVCQPRLATAP